jgi:gamma-glutamyltranspeptidase
MKTEPPSATGLLFLECLEIEMNAEEKDMFGKSAAAVKGLVEDMKRLGLS